MCLYSIPIADHLRLRYVSDSMGHPPAIPDNSYTTKMPVDVDEAAFSPSSSSIPTPSSDDHASKYFGLKLRCVGGRTCDVDCGLTSLLFYIVWPNLLRASRSAL